MTALTDFLLARYAEDEKTADVDEQRGHISPDGYTRALADLAGKRRIVERHSHVETGIVSDHGGQDEVHYCGHCGMDLDEGDCPDLLDLAAPYVDHPDYDEEWTP